MPPREDFFRKELVTELRRVENMVRREPSVEKKIYYFSAAYGIAGRNYRYSFSEDVLIMDILLHNAYNMMTDRLNLAKTGNTTVEFDAQIFEKICDGLVDLANCIESGENVFEPLKKITTAGFALTGPGNYLREKGDLKL
jgi:hypothetical protein